MSSGIKAMESELTSFFPDRAVSGQMLQRGVGNKDQSRQGVGISPNAPGGRVTGGLN